MQIRIVIYNNKQDSSMFEVANPKEWSLVVTINEYYILNLFELF